MMLDALEDEPIDAPPSHYVALRRAPLTAGPRRADIIGWVSKGAIVQRLEGPVQGRVRIATGWVSLRVGGVHGTMGGTPLLRAARRWHRRWWHRRIPPTSSSRRR